MNKTFWSSFKEEWRKQDWSELKHRWFLVFVVCLSLLTLSSCATREVPVPIISIPTIYPCLDAKTATSDTLLEAMQYNGLQYNLCRKQTDALIQWKAEMEKIK